MKKWAFVAFGAAVGLSVVLSNTGSYEDYKSKTLGDFKDASISAKKAVVESYVEDSGLPENQLDKIYACFSQNAYTKSRDVDFSTAAEWCSEAYEYEYLDRYVSFDNFEKNFSPSNGAFRPLEKALKDSIGDKDSYEHVSSRYSLALGDNTPYALVETTFRANNNQGVKVKNSVTAKVDIVSGEMIGIQ